MFLGISGELWQTIGIIFGIFAAVVAAIVFVIRSIFKLGKFSHRIGSVEKLTNEMKTELKDVSSKLDVLVGKVSVILKDSIADELSASQSPRQLNDIGKKVLRDSSIEQVIEPKFDDIIDELKSINPENPYQAQEALLDVVQQFKDDEGLLPAIENGAFLSGRTPEEVLFVGALNIRDRVIEALGLQVGDIDKHDPSKAKD